MKYLALLLVGASACYGQNFSAFITDITTGESRIYSGNVTTHLTKDEELSLHHERMMEFFEAQRQRRYEAEQLRLLRQIANQQ